MSLPPAPAPLTDADYEMIAAAVLETARGRWFLSEHARRNRHADTRLVLQAIERLEHSIAQRAMTLESDRMHLDLVEMMNAITRTKAEIASLKPGGEHAGRIDEASNELDAIVETTAKATSDILAAAERIQEIAWTMREQGIEASICDLLDSNTSEVYTACSFQDLTGQRIRKVIQVFRFLEARIDAMIKIWRLDDLELVPADDTVVDASLVNGPAQPGLGLQQPAIDELLAVQRTEDVFWRENAAGNRDPRNLGEFDLDDLEVFDAPADERPAAGAAPAADTAATAPAIAPDDRPPSMKPDAKTDAAARGDGIEALSPAERLALFS